MSVERRGRVTGVIVGPTGNRRSSTQWRKAAAFQAVARAGKNREVYTRFCELLRVKFPGPTRRVMTERTGSCWALLTLRPLASLSASS